MVNSTACDPFRICFRTQDCWDYNETLADPSYNSPTAAGWIIFVSSLLIGIFCLVMAELGPRYPNILHPYFWISQRCSFSFLGNKTSKQCYKDRDTDHSSDFDDVEVGNLFHAFVTTHRSEDNFVRNNADANMKQPNPHPSEYEPCFHNNVLFPISGLFTISKNKNSLFSPSWVAILLGSLGWALVCSALSTVLFLLIQREKRCSGLQDETAIADWVRNMGQAWLGILADYHFFPIFLVVGYIGFIVQRWREWMVNCHAIQATLHDVAMLCGGCVGPNPELPVRKKLYKIYRYLNLIHALCYKNVSPTLDALELETDFVDLGLVTVDEAYALSILGTSQRENVLSWLVANAAELLRMNKECGACSDAYLGVGEQLMNAIRGLRGATAEHHDLFIRDNPNMYLHMMVLVVNLMTLLVIVSYPFALVIDTPPFFPFPAAAQPVVAFGVGILTFTLRAAYALLVRLRNPFSWTVDQIRVDSLLASSDRITFRHLRAMFDAATTCPEEYGGMLNDTQKQELRSSIQSLSKRRKSSTRTRVSVVSAARASVARQQEVIIPISNILEI